MNYEKYIYYNDKEFKSINKEKKDFEETSEIMIFSFKGPDGKNIETKKITKKEYNILSEGDKYNLNKWSLSRDYVNNYRKTLEEFSLRLGNFVTDFKKNIPSIFISDFANENNIDGVMAENILKYTLTNINYTANIIMDTESEDFSAYWIEEVTFEKFINADVSVYEYDLKKINDMMENNLNFLKLAKGV